MKQIAVIYHRADFDGLFCREIALKFLGDQAEYVGWDFGDKPLAIPEGEIYVMDLPVDRVFGFEFSKPETIPPRFGNSRDFDQVTWIDHHKSSIASHPTFIPGYRIDGVAACRLAWQWFTFQAMPIADRPGLPDKQEFIDRRLGEPYAVQLAGEYDVWDHRNPDAAVFQFGLRSVPPEKLRWSNLLGFGSTLYIDQLLFNGRLLQAYQQQQDAKAMERSCLVEFEGLKFLALNSAGGNSLTFAAADVPDEGHEALMLFYWQDSVWHVSLYHAKHRTELDLSAIAARHGGGGHRGACGFQTKELTFAGEQ